MGLGGVCVQPGWEPQGPAESSFPMTASDNHNRELGSPQDTDWSMLSLYYTTIQMKSVEYSGCQVIGPSVQLGLRTIETEDGRDVTRAAVPAL